MPSKQTKRERKELAKKQRLEEMRARAKRQRRRKLTSVLTAVIAVAAIVSLVLWNNARNRAAAEKRNRVINTAAQTLGCGKVEEPPELASRHIQPPNKAQQYSSEPPTSGEHYALANGGGPAFTGVHTSPVEDEASVHNLEHGHVAIQYAAEALSKSVMSTLEQFTKANDTTVLMAPRAKPEFVQKDILALTAWNRVVHCPKGMKDDPAQVKALVEAFYGQFKNKAPEEVPGQPNRAAG